MTSCKSSERLTRGVVLVGPMPPPLGGQAVLVQSILESSLALTHGIESLDISRSRSWGWLRFGPTAKSLVRLGRMLWSSPQLQLVHVHCSAGLSLFEKSLYVALARVAGRRVLLHVHGGRMQTVWRRSGSIKKQLIRAVLRSCHGVIVLSEHWLPLYREEIKYTGTLFCLPNSVQVSVVSRRNRVDETVAVLYVGHLKEEKGLIDLLTAMKELGGRAAKCVRLTLMGAGETENAEVRIRRRYRELAPQRYQFLGALTGAEKWEAFAEADMLVLPSHSEDLPLSVLEAMSLGLPVIATRVGAIPTLITDGQEGRLVEPGDAEGLREALEALSVDWTLRRRMGEAARKKFNEEFSFDAYIKRLGSIYSDMLRTSVPS